MKPYLRGEMAKLNATGRPLNRPIWWDFPLDRSAWTVDDEYMFGDEYLAAPVLHAGARSRAVYLPAASNATTIWRHVWTNVTYKGGKSYTIDAPLDSFPLFRRGAVAVASP
jgi:alpha-D-xyloside xylohydrolase